MADTLRLPVDDVLRDALQRMAEDHGTTPEYEALIILRGAVLTEEESHYGFGSRIVALFSGIGIGLDEDIPKIRGDFGFQIPNFDEE